MLLSIKTEAGPAVNLASLPQPLPRRELAAALLARGIRIKRIPTVGQFAVVVDLVNRCIDTEG